MLFERKSENIINFLCQIVEAFRRQTNLPVASVRALVNVVDAIGRIWRN